MGYKSNDSCLNKVADDEPIFVLRAQDTTAPYYVERWAVDNRNTLSQEKYAEALALAAAMRIWADKYKDKAKLPD